ncbi:hypothetical protein CBL_01938 [Carabus blaptoides fortunei]
MVTGCTAVARCPDAEDSQWSDCSIDHPRRGACQVTGVMGWWSSVVGQSDEPSGRVGTGIHIMPMVREDVLYIHHPLLRLPVHQVRSVPIPLRDAATDDASDRDYGLAKAYYWIDGNVLARQI